VGGGGGFTVYANESVDTGEQTFDTYTQNKMQLKYVHLIIGSCNRLPISLAPSSEAKVYGKYLACLLLKYIRLF
jgi:hypothetical protein